MSEQNPTTKAETNSTLSETDRQASLEAALRDGMLHALSIGAGESFLSAFGVMLRASVVQIGLLSSLPPFIGAIAQAFSLWLSTHISSRRRLIVFGATAQAFFWFPIACLPFLFGTGSPAAAVLILCVCLYQVCFGLTVPAWNALIGDIVPPAQRGNFFGRRNRLVGFATFIAMTAAGALLNYCDKLTAGSILGSCAGFAVIFSLAGVCRYYSSRQLARYADVPSPQEQDSFFSFLDFLRRAPSSNFGKFVFFSSIINFAVNFSGPYFALYMLRELKFSYLQFTVITAIATVTQFLTMQHWGRISDEFGNKRIMNLCGFGIVISPWFWLINTSIPFLVLVQVYAGFVWAGYNLAASNFLFDSVSPAKRARCAAYQAVVSATLVLCGSLAGGYSAAHLDLWMEGAGWTPANSLQTIFFVSGLIRLLAAWMLLPRFKEVREVRHVGRGEYLYQVLNLKPFSGSTMSLVATTENGERETNQP